MVCQRVGMARSRPLRRADLRVEIQVRTLGSDRRGLDEGPAVLTSGDLGAERDRSDQNSVVSNS
jgi:hypothetical protein